ncbi:DUF3068 domain-containing protein [Corynebacterium tapiri]|uniref:DUF3068 domain-containing protein n=1 Tax=Corynebacterium tapiri TaxID=1448266 RepID=A0A5C4U4K5_9CORY|nr:DUF3068 domain-containing protein [Corynebacterium tapiri]TNL98589.1 DUF3068 domain-containing protein [Corynebacterium tapiri]
MLPLSRVLSALLLGLGIALVAGGFLAPALINADGRLPLDLRNTTWTISDEKENVSHQLHLQVQPPADEDTTAVRIGSTWFRGQGAPEELMTAQTWSYSLDRVTGEATTPATLTHTIGMPAAQVHVDGHWLKIPVESTAPTLPIFDETLRAAVPAQRMEDEEIEGRPVNHYRQTIEPTNVAQRYAGLANTKVVPTPEGGTEQLYLFHSASKDLYFDQVTGLLVDARVNVDQFYGRADGARVEEGLKFHGAMHDDQTAALIKELSGVHGASAAQWWRWVVIGLGAFLSVIGLLGAFLGKGRSTTSRSAGGSTRVRQ